MKKQTYDLEGRLLDYSVRIIKNDILQETEASIKIFVTSTKTAEKKPRLGVVECSVLGVCFLFDVGRSMFDVHLSE
jgi:hypothetical protein